MEQSFNALKWCSVIFFFAISALVSCGEGDIPRSTFDSPFPKRNINMTAVFGDEFSLKQNRDTLRISVSSDASANTFVDSKSGDTLFYGKICKYRGLFYFNIKLNDTSYWIYAVKRIDNLLYGLNSAFEEAILVDREMEKNNYPRLLKYADKEKKFFRLHPVKKELKKLFSSVLDSIVPDTILTAGQAEPETAEAISASIQYDSEEFELLSKVYPNPTKGITNVYLQKRTDVMYQLHDMEGKTLLEGKFSDIVNRIDLRQFPDEGFILTLFDPEENQKEAIRIIKAK